MKRIPKTLAGLVAGLVMVVGAMVLMFGSLTPRTPGTPVDIDRALAAVAAGNVTHVTFADQDSRMLLTTRGGQRLWAAYPGGGAATPGLVARVMDAHVPLDVDQQWGRRTTAIVAEYILPLLLLADLFGIFMLLARGGAGQVRDLFAFSRIGSSASRPGQNRVRFSDVAGAGEALSELAEVRDYLADPGRFAQLRARPPRGVLLYGPPGCGKTLLARALAGEAGVPFFAISGSEFVESLVGVGAARMRDLFARARASAPAIIFVDELDAAGRKRGAGLGGGNDEREQTLNEMLVQMDGFDPSLGVVVIAATNRPDILDPALLRPGRFDRHVALDAPDVAGRTQILQLHAADRPIDPSVDLAAVARSCPGFTGADLANLVNEAALMAVRRQASSISAADIEEAVQRALVGPRRASHALTADEVERLALHEAGHLVVAHAVDFPGALTRASIISRGRGLASADVVRTDRSVLTRRELLAEMTITMGGVAAERLGTGEMSTTSESDIERATDLARRFAGRYGMSELVGPVRVLQKDAEVFLGRDYLTAQNLSHNTMERVDTAVRELVEEASASALSVLQRRRKLLDSVTSALVERETLDEDALRRLLGARAAGAA